MSAQSRRGFHFVRAALFARIFRYAACEAVRLALRFNLPDMSGRLNGILLGCAAAAAGIAIISGTDAGRVLMFGKRPLMPLCRQLFFPLRVAGFAGHYEGLPCARADVQQSYQEGCG